MDAFLVLLVLALLVMQAILLGRLSGFSRDMDLLRKQLAEFMRGNANAPDPAPMKDPAPVVPPPPIVLPPAPPSLKPEAPPAVLDDETVRMRAAFPENGPPKPPPFIVQAPVHPAPPLRPPPPPRPGFFERHPDLEKFIGENLINKIGIAVLVLGIGLLLNYAIGKGLLSTTAQTLIGLGAGALLVFFAHRLRKNFRAFSSVLVAGGIAIFYTTIAIAFHKFQIIGQTPAFIIMVAITGLAVALTLGYDRKELAVIALLGGFAAPFLASSGEGNYKVLFTYLLILDAGMLVLAGYKKWHIINVLSFALTLLVFAAWAIDPYTSLEPRPALIAFGFATAFFLVFFAMNLRYNLKHRQAFTALDHSLLLVNTAAFYSAGMFFLSDLEMRVTGLFTALLGLFYLLFALYFHKREGIPQTLKLLLIGLVLTFISLAAPVQLEGSYITLFWAAEAVLLLWFSHRTGLKLVERGSMAVMVLMCISLWMDLAQVYAGPYTATMRPVLNKGWISGIAGTLSLGATWWLLRRNDRSVDMLIGITRGGWSVAALIIGLVTFYATNVFEGRVILLRSFHPTVVGLAVMAWTLIYVIAMEWALRRTGRAVRAIVLALCAFVALLFITVHYANSRSALWMNLNSAEGAGFLFFHVLATTLMVVALVRMALLVRVLIPRSSTGWSAYLWCVALFLVVFASQELDHTMILGQRSTDALTDARRVGYPILWGVGSFLFMWYGMRQRMRMMRVIALSLFAITLLKLFLFDLRSLSEGGRVAAFIFLGALLLVISFMYQKIKGLFVDDAPKTDDANATHND